MVRATVLLGIVMLAGCSSDLEGFEHDLMGVDAKAWALCNAEFKGRVYSAPPYGEHDDKHILFAWYADKAESEGGPIYCETNGDGTKLIKVKMSKKALSESR